MSNMSDLCNHKNNEGKFIVAYDNDYEMNSDEMYCIRCGRRGSRIDILQEGDAIDGIRTAVIELPDEMCAAEAIDVMMANYPNARKASLVKAFDLSLDLLAKEAKIQGAEPLKYNMEKEKDPPSFILLDQPFRLFELP